MSLAWHFEYEIWGSLYASSDLLNMQHSADFFGWDDRLRAAFRKRRDKPLCTSAVASWKEGATDRAAATCAWGLTRFLIRQHAAILPSAPDRLAAIYYRKGRIHRATYVEPIPGFQPSPEDQEAVIAELCGDDVLSSANEAFRVPRKDRARKTAKAPRDAKPGMD